MARYLVLVRNKTVEAGFFTNDQDKIEKEIQPLLDEGANHAWELHTHNAVRSSVSQALRLTQDEAAWLRSNQPEACYRPVHEGWRQAMLKYQEAFEAVEYGLSPPVTARDVERGTALMQEGTGLVDTATLLLTLTSC
jgi:hypothetical protein